MMPPLEVWILKRVARREDDSMRLLIVPLVASRVARSETERRRLDSRSMPRLRVSVLKVVRMRPGATRMEMSSVQRERSGFDTGEAFSMRMLDSLALTPMPSHWDCEGHARVTLTATSESCSSGARSRWTRPVS